MLGCFYDAIVELFQGSGISISADGKRHLGGALGSPSFVSSFVQERVSTWTKELDLLSDISVIHPHAAYAAFTHAWLCCQVKLFDEVYFLLRLLLGSVFTQFNRATFI